MKTRRSLGGEVPVLGIPAVDFHGSMLPTGKDVLACYVYLREKLKLDSGKTQYPTRHAVLQAAIARTAAVWETAGLPVVSPQRIHQKLNKLVSEIERLRDYPQKKRDGAYGTRQQVFVNECEELFDICSCKCTSACTCEEDTKAQVNRRRPFLEDQRGDRALTILGAAGASPQHQEQPPTVSSSPASSSVSDLRPKTAGSSPTCSSGASSSLSSPSPEKRRRTAQEQRDVDFIPKIAKVSRPVTQNTIPLPNSAATAARYNISSTAAAALCSAFAADTGLVTPQNKTLLVDPSKMRRQTTTAMEGANVAGLQRCSQLCGIFFDGRKDAGTLVKEDLPGQSIPGTRHVTEQENHITLVAEPGSTFVGHVTAVGSSAADEARAIIGGLNERGVATGGIRAAGCDGTSYNTGPWDGVMASLEKELGRPLLRIICLLHFTELPLKRLMTRFDGPSSGPESWTGPVGMQLKTAETLPVGKFKVIDGRLPDVTKEMLNWEQKYLYDITLGVITGVVPGNLAARNPGKLHQARWVTLASRLLRVYVAHSRPRATLTRLATYIVKVYVPCMFGIKREPLAVQGPHHLFEHIKASRCLPRPWQEVVQESISINGFFAHPENILLSMLVDEREPVRQLAVERILDARAKVGAELRAFAVPEINFGAQEYTELVDWETVWVTPPPLLADFSNEQLQAAACGGPIPLPALPCHTQAVERLVHEVTVAAGRVVGEERRDGLIRVKVASREAMPKFSSKKDFKPPTGSF